MKTLKCLMFVASVTSALLAVNVSVASATPTEKSVESDSQVKLQQFTVTALVPPTSGFKLDDSFVEGNQVFYRVTFKNDSSSVEFITDRVGQLIGFHVVIDDHNVAYLHLDASNAWVQKDGDEGRKITFDTALWTKFFEKIAPVPTTIAKPLGVVTLERDSSNAARNYEFVGYSYDPQNKRQVLVREVGTKLVKSLLEDDFVMLPPEDRPFYLGNLDGRLCAVENTTVNDKIVSFVAVEVGKP